MVQAKVAVLKKQFGYQKILITSQLKQFSLHQENQKKGQWSRKESFLLPLYRVLNYKWNELRILGYFTFCYLTFSLMRLLQNKMALTLSEKEIRVALVSARLTTVQTKEKVSWLFL